MRPILSHPDLHSLDLLVSVAECGSISKAAKAHHMSQPSASARLRSLERVLGVELLERSPTGSSLTEEGAAIADQAREVLEATHRLNSYGESLRVGTRNRLMIAASPTVAAYLLPGALARFGRDHQRAQVNAKTAPSEQVISDVRSGAVQLGFIESKSHLPASVHCRQVGQDKLVLVVPPTDAATTLSPSEVLSLDLAVGEADGDARQTFEDEVQAAGYPAPRFRIELGSDPGAKSLAIQSGQPTLLSELAVREDLAKGRLVSVPVGLPLDRPFRAIWVGRLQPFAEELLDVVPKGLRVAA